MRRKMQTNRQPTLNKAIFHQVSEISQPLHRIVRIVMLDENCEEVYSGTGTLISECFVLTCFFNIILKEKGKFQDQVPPKLCNPKRLEVEIRTNSNSSPTICSVKDFMFQIENLSQISTTKDFALLLIEKPIIPILEKEIQLAIPEESIQVFEIYGCSSSLNKLIGGWIRAHKMGSSLISYSIPVEKGLIGSPIFVYIGGGNFQLIGIHLGSIEEKHQHALKITKQIIDTVKIFRRVLEDKNS